MGNKRINKLGNEKCTSPVGERIEIKLAPIM
jgi:hypothetical protein